MLQSLLREQLLQVLQSLGLNHWLLLHDINCQWAIELFKAMGNGFGIQV